MSKQLLGMMVLGFSAAHASTLTCGSDNFSACPLQLLGPNPAIVSPLICGDTETLVYTLKNNSNSSISFTKFISGISAPSNVVITNMGTCGTIIPAKSQCSIDVLITAAACSNIFPETIDVSLVVHPGGHLGDLSAPIDLVVTSLSCATVGAYSTDSGTIHYLPLSYYSLNYGKDWASSITPPPTNGHMDYTLTAVSCVATGQCSTVGYFASPSYGLVSYVSNDFGKDWALSATQPVSAATFPLLEGVSCNASGDCAAVGYDSSAYQPIAYYSSDFGNNWTAAPTLPLPSGATFTQLIGVSCDNTSHCAAVGSYKNGSVYVPLAYSSNNLGHSWILSTTPPPPQTGTGNNELFGISCDSTHNRCSAVGKSDNGPLSYTSNDFGVTWTVSSTLPPVTGVGDYFLDDVSCDKKNRCAAVGYIKNGSTFSPVSYVSHDFGVTWQVSSVPLPAQIGSTDTEFYGVSCDTSAHCSAVGFYSVSGEYIPLSYTSKDFGNTWTISTTLPPAQSNFNNGLFAVSCQMQ